MWPFAPKRPFYMTPARTLAFLVLLCLALLWPGAADACADPDCDRADVAGMANTAVGTDACCADRCPADEDTECPPRCSFCSCCPGAAQIVLVAPAIVVLGEEMRVAVPLVEPQRVVNTPQHVFRPPRLDSRSNVID